ncbi:uncharacterized protein TRUGW13939_05963 [Talaromyces rugulosus]|uniref:Uncharacterized protein n=1 Tax=Talaromyces rugulosus TaxID=121627 RepID=A0A7H8QZF0_TALRU|nr:uncharacterized protein TRUGW13939_05963 [Talaromyces rugulosus]QKX58835.1 hypothetical protein TRUGW13939_05963 [Talaromyces rugulosus]
MHTLITTLSSTFSLLAAAAAATTATSSAASSSSTIDVHVGQNNQLTFSPSSITAAQGSTINFHFYPANHSVAESLSTVFSVTLNDTNARWLYSAQKDGDECQGGMVMVINPPDNQADTLDAYIKAASIASNSTNGHVVMGGLLVENASSSSSSSSSSVSTQVSVTFASGTTGSGTAGSTTGTSTATGSGTVGPTTAAATSTGSTGTTAATTSATTGAAAGATSTGAANAQGYKNSVGIGAGALLLGIWYYL